MKTWGQKNHKLPRYWEILSDHHPNVLFYSKLLILLITDISFSKKTTVINNSPIESLKQELLFSPI